MTTTPESKQIHQDLICCYPNNVVHAVYVTVANVDPYGPEREAVFLPRTVDGDGRARHIDGWTEVTAGR